MWQETTCKTTQHYAHVVETSWIYNKLHSFAKQLSTMYEIAFAWWCIPATLEELQKDFFIFYFACHHHQLERRTHMTLLALEGLTTMFLLWHWSHKSFVTLLPALSVISHNIKWCESIVSSFQTHFTSLKKISITLKSICPATHETVW
jgi:hypothetical protein